MNFFRHVKVRAHQMGKTFGPMSEYLYAAESMLEMQGNQHKLWFAGQYRNLAIAATLLKRKQVVALPTDTVYGLACLANDSEGIKKLYDIKGRDPAKPLAICVSKVEDIAEYAVVTEQVEQLLRHFLPGPYTIILKRTDKVNDDLNPGHDTIGVRVPDSWFIRNVVEMSEPIALTSANKSGQRSCVSIEEFADLWPQLGGVFHYPYAQNRQEKRKGSTVIDFSIPGQYQIIREGMACHFATSYLNKHGLTRVGIN